MTWRPWESKPGRQDGIPSWVGLSLTGLYLGLVLSLGAVYMWCSHTQARSAERENLQRWVSSVGRCIEFAVAANGPAALTPELRRASRERNIQRCEIVDGRGRIVASSDTTRVGRRVAAGVLAGLPGTSDAEPQTLDNEENRKGLSCAIRLRRIPPVAAAAASRASAEAPAASSRAATSPGEPAPAEITAAGPLWLLAETYGAQRQWATMQWWTAVGYVVLAGLSIFWMLYRLTVRTIRPMAAIRQRLLTAHGRIEERLALLRVNDTMDQATAAWNQLVEFIREMREELHSVQLRTAVDSTLNAYRSERLATVLRQIPQGVLVIEENGQISFANRAASRMLGQEGDLTGRDVKDTLPEPLRASVLGGGRGAGGWVDYAVDGAEGSTTVRFTAMPFEKDAQTAGSIVIMQDVSQFKEVERARDAFLYHVTHELRTPLTNIRAYAETLAGGVLDDEASLRECYNVIAGETERLGRLVEDILNVSQLEVGTARMSFGEVHMDRLLRDAVQDIQAQADAKGIDLRLKLPPKLPTIRGDKERLSVVVANLLGNAIKYTPSGGHVELVCEVDAPAPPDGTPGALRIAVSDTGIGIEPAHHEKIFEKFYRVNDERVGAQPGTGLGLAIVKETVRMHGGTVTVESTPGRGSTFRVTLPITTA